MVVLTYFSNSFRWLLLNGNFLFQDLYIHVGWPLYRTRKYGHAFEVRIFIVTDPDSVLNSLTREVKEIGPDGKEVILLCV